MREALVSSTWSSTTSTIQRVKTTATTGSGAGSTSGATSQTVQPRPRRFPAGSAPRTKEQDSLFLTSAATDAWTSSYSTSTIPAARTTATTASAGTSATPATYSDSSADVRGHHTIRSRLCRPKPLAQTVP